MKYIQIAPSRKDCTINKTTITGKMGKRTFVFQLAPGDTFNLAQGDAFIEAFCMAIAISSKQHQVENLLNEYFGITGGKFYEQ